MLKAYAVINGEGNIIDEVAVEDVDKHGDIKYVYPNYITPNYEKRLFVPKWDFEKEDWVEGLTPEEVATREEEIENMNNKISGEEMNAIAIMELAQIIMGSD